MLAGSHLSFGSHLLKNFISPFPKTSPWYLCAAFCCIFIFISFPVYKMAVIGAANQGCLDSKHAATRRWALCDPGTAMLIFLHGKDHFSAKLNHDFLQQRRELLPQKKPTKNLLTATRTHLRSILLLIGIFPASTLPYVCPPSF